MTKLADAFVSRAMATAPEDTLTGFAAELSRSIEFDPRFFDNKFASLAESLTASAAKLAFPEDTLTPVAGARSRPTKSFPGFFDNKFASLAESLTASAAKLAFPEEISWPAKGVSRETTKRLLVSFVFLYVFLALTYIYISHKDQLDPFATIFGASSFGIAK